MFRSKKITFSLFFLFQLALTNSIFGQDLNLTVLIDGTNLEFQDKKPLIEDMKSSITNFYNTKKWTNDKFALDERIKATLMITLQEMPSIGKYKGFATIVSSRPVYGTSYESAMINYIDKNFEFDYVMSQPMDFNENSYQSNLTSILAFYAYIVLAFDYDSFSKNGGTAYLEKAQQTLNAASQVGEKGWKQYDNNANSRYWLLENLMNPQFSMFRESTYKYYRTGLDEAYSNPEQIRTNILSQLDDFKKINDTKPGSMLLRTYFNTKAEEIINFMKLASSPEKMKAYNILKELDPTNSDRYEKLIQG